MAQTAADIRGGQSGELDVFIKSRVFGGARRTAANVDGGGSGEPWATQKAVKQGIFVFSRIRPSYRSSVYNYIHLKWLDAILVNSTGSQQRWPPTPT